MKDLMEPFTGDIDCPHCGRKQKFLMHPFINARKEPDLKRQVLDGSIFDMTCAQCGNVTRVGYMLFYYDAVERLMFYVCDREHTEQAYMILKMLKTQKDWKPALSGCRFRACLEPPQLSEAILIADRNMDDRVVAMMKAVLKVCYAEQQNKPKPERIQLVEADGLHFLVFPTADSIPELVAFDQSAYDTIQSEYAPFFPQDAQSNLMINDQWAEKLLHPAQVLQ